MAVIVCCGDRPVTPELLRGLSNTLIASHQYMTLDTHAGEGHRGRYDYWYHSGWLMSDPDPAVGEYRPCPRCGGTGKGVAGTDCPVCQGRPWRANWDFEVGHPVAWVRQAVVAGLIEQRPNLVLAPDGRLYPWSWFEWALAKFPECWVVPMHGGP